MRADRLTDVVTDHGEGAGWHPDDGVAKVVDVFAGDLLTVHEDGTVERRHVADLAAAWRPRAGGGTVVAIERGFAALDAQGAEEWRVEAFADRNVRMNEGTCDPHGRFYCGSMAYDAAPGAGAMWRLDADRSVHHVSSGLTIPNGMVWAPDGATAYHVDTPRGTIDAWSNDPRTGALTERRPVVNVGGGDPDGMTIDTEGGLWVAIWGGGAVHRYEPSGALTQVIEVDAAQVTSCAFVGAALDTLVITTSRHGLDAAEDRWAGAVFTAHPGARGLAPLPFSG